MTKETDILDFAVDLALESGRIQRSKFSGRFDIHYKGEINLVTDVDLECQARIIALIRAGFPDDEIIAEEQTNVYTEGRNRWIIDPIDGTTNYAHGYPFFCTSIAYERQGKLLCGVVYNPVFEELFFARKGAGAYLNGDPIHVSRVPRLRQGLLSTGFPYDLNQEQNNLNHWANFIYKSQALRRDGSAALNLCYLAAGRFDGFWELSLNAWDLAAGSLVVEEAGGRITQLTGRPFNIYEGEVCASNGLIHEEMLAVLREGS